MSWPRAVRLTRPADFQRVREEGASAVGSFFRLGVLFSGEVRPARFGIITSRRAGEAVDRSRIRRRLRGILRHDRARVMDGTDVVVVAKSTAASADSASLRREWLRLAGRLSIFRSDS